MYLLLSLKGRQSSILWSLLCRFHWLYHCCHSPFVTRCHLLSLVVTRSITRCHSLSLVAPFVVTRFHSLSLVVIRCTTRCHSWSFVVTRCHLLSLAVPLVYLFITDQQKSWTLWLQNVIIPFKINLIEKPNTRLIPELWLWNFVIPFKINLIEKPHTFDPRTLIFKLQQVLTMNDICVSWSSPKLTRTRIF